jgi:hypothetical protein
MQKASYRFFKSQKNSHLIEQMKKALCSIRKKIVDILDTRKNPLIVFSNHKRIVA